jgi:hypothetical protein
MAEHVPPTNDDDIRDLVRERYAALAEQATGGAQFCALRNAPSSEPSVTTTTTGPSYPTPPPSPRSGAAIPPRSPICIRAKPFWTSGPAGASMSCCRPNVSGPVGWHTDST